MSDPDPDDDGDGEEFVEYEPRVGTPEREAWQRAKNGKVLRQVDALKCRIIPQYTLSAPFPDGPTHEQIDFFARWLATVRDQLS